MSPLTTLKIMNGRMRSNTIIPNHNSPLFPLDPSLTIRALSDMIIQKSQNRIRLLFLKPNNMPRKLFIDKDRFGACDGMNADHGVDVRNWFTTDVTSCCAGVGGLF
jgi:hypothetical protein